MRKIKFFREFYKISLIILMTTVVSCSTEQLSGQQELNKNTLMDKMAMDDDYVAFLNAAGESAKMIAAGEVDLNAISRILDENKITQSFCRVDEKIVSAAKGGVEYMRINCEISNRLNAFKQKFPEYGELLNEDDRKQVSIKSKMMNGMDYRGREIGDILLNSNKNQ